MPYSSGLVKPGQNNTGYRFGYENASAPATPPVPSPTDLQNQFQVQLMESLRSPGLPPDVVEGIINKGTEEISESERGASMRARQLAGAEGFAASGGAAEAERALAADYSGQRANLARDVRLAAAMQAQRDRMAALGLGSQAGASNRLSGQLTGSTYGPRNIPSGGTPRTSGTPQRGGPQVVGGGTHMTADQFGGTSGHDFQPGPGVSWRPRKPNPGLPGQVRG